MANYIRAGKIFFCASVVALIGVSVMRNRKEQRIYKNTPVFKTAMQTLANHETTKYFLGDKLEHRWLKILDEKEEGDGRTYHVRVALLGNKGSGNMHFWVHQSSPYEAELQRIELQLAGGMLLISDEVKKFSTDMYDSDSINGPSYLKD